MSDRKKRTLHFDSIEEPRDAYFVEYHPPGGEARFALLILVFHGATTVAAASSHMEAEATRWTERYAVPVMVRAVDETGDTIEVSDSWEHTSLIAWRHPGGHLEKHWRLLKDEELPEDALSEDYLLKVYEDVPYRTDADVKANANRIWANRRRGLRAGLVVIIAWGVVVPAAVALVGWANPAFGLLVTLYALWKAARHGGLMLGWFKPLEFEKAKREKESRMRHYFLHCERNPEGFRRIVAENFKRDEGERIEREAHELTKALSGPGEGTSDPWAADAPR